MLYSLQKDIQHSPFDDCLLDEEKVVNIEYFKLLWAEESLLG